MQILSYSDIINTETFCFRDVLFRRRYVTGDVLLRRRFVKETFCMETFCRGDVSCGDFLYVRRKIPQQAVFLCSSILYTLIKFWNCLGGEEPQDLMVESVNCHPGWNSDTFQNDICILKLSQPANDSESGSLYKLYNTRKLSTGISPLMQLGLKRTLFEFFTFARMLRTPPTVLMG
jgi:hypothetical protein